MRRTVQDLAAFVHGGNLCRRVARRETESAEHETVADWFTRARDSRCAELSKTWPPSYVPVTLTLHFVFMGCV